jgi:ABC-2 type transport system permease protein
MAKATEAVEREDVEDAIDSKHDSDEEVDSERPMHAAATPSGVAESGAGRGFKNVMTIASRELRSYFDSLIAYVVLGGTMLALGFYFFFPIPSTGPTFWQTDHATMSRMFEFFPKWLVLMIPLVTMRTIADEKRTGTLELLITMPVRDSEVIIGKYLGALAMMLLLFLGSLLYPIAMFVQPWQLGPLDWGPVAAGYVGLLLFTMTGLAIGLMFSSLTESQILAFFFTFGMFVLLAVFGAIGESVHGWMGEVLTFVSPQARFAPFERGLIDTKAVIYFMTITIICLLVAFRSLESRKWS